MFLYRLSKLSKLSIEARKKHHTDKWEGIFVVLTIFIFFLKLRPYPYPVKGAPSLPLPLLFFLSLLKSITSLRFFIESASLYT